MNPTRIFEKPVSVCSQYPLYLTNERLYKRKRIKILNTEIVHFFNQKYLVTHQKVNIV